MWGERYRRMVRGSLSIEVGSMLAMLAVPASKDSNACAEPSLRLAGRGNRKSTAWSILRGRQPAHKPFKLKRLQNRSSEAFCALPYSAHGQGRWCQAPTLPLTGCAGLSSRRDHHRRSHRRQNDLHRHSRRHQSDRHHRRPHNRHRRHRRSHRCVEDVPPSDGLH